MYIYDYKKSLKIPKGQSEFVYRRRTDNTIAKRKSTKGQTTIYITLHRKLKIHTKNRSMQFMLMSFQASFVILLDCDES